MPRAKKGPKARRRRNRILKWAKGYRGKLYMREKMDGVNVLRTWVYAAPNRGLWRWAAKHLFDYATGSVGSPARPASSVTASGKLMCSYSIKKPMALPFLPQPKQ